MELVTTKLSPRAIFEELESKVVGQKEAKRQVSIGLFVHVINHLQELSGRARGKSPNMLIMGPTGCGKTYIARNAVKAVRKITGLPLCPLLEVDCTEITPRGWQGDDMSSLIKDKAKELMSSSVHSLSTAVVFLDEFDKICLPAHSSKMGGDFNRATQYNLLKLMEGVEMSFGGSLNKEKVDTSSMMFMLAGNFPQVRSARIPGKAPIGFNSKVEGVGDYDLYQELEMAGAATQLVGRLSYISEVKALTKAQLSTILDQHLLPSQLDIFDFLNTTVKVPKATRKSIVENCFKRGTGARGLEADLAEHLSKSIFELEITL